LDKKKNRRYKKQVVDLFREEFSEGLDPDDDDFKMPLITLKELD
jgi:hypothetical protein